MNVDFYLNEKVKQADIESGETNDYIQLYADINDARLSRLFAYMHISFNNLFKFMKAKYRSNHHFNALQSCQLISVIDLYENMQFNLKDTEYSFDINESYKNQLNRCKVFLKNSGGSEIPEHFEFIDLVEFDPIFSINKNIVKKDNKKIYKLQPIGNGSFSKVYKYHDDDYDIDIAVKKVKEGLSDKDLERFKIEFNMLKSFSSPYILKVYNYNCEKNEYTMECMDSTLYDYINNNQDKIDENERYSIARQIIKAMYYVHSKSIYHRDLSFVNFLIKKYEDVTLVKLGDFGIAKDLNNQITSLNSSVKGSLNDLTHLEIKGFEHYSIQDEMFALSRVIYFVMTGRQKIDKPKKGDKYYILIQKGIVDGRYDSLEELENELIKAKNDKV